MDAIEEVILWLLKLKRHKLVWTFWTVTQAWKRLGNGFFVYGELSN